jgi:hypothetical protein
MVNIIDLNWLKINNKSFRGFSYLCLVGLWLGLCQPLYGQGTLAETATAVGLQEEIDSGGAQPATSKPAAKPKPAAAPEANAVAGKQSIEKLEKVAQKLMQSMQSDRYDQADFSAVYTIVPKDANFSDGINAMLKPVFDQFGKAEKLGEGRVVGLNRAVFPVQFTKGTANMTVSLDPQDKIVEWTLTPSGPVAGGASTKPVEAVQGLSKDANVPDINDFNSFQRELNRINIESRSEEEQWLGRLEKKVELARAIDELVAAQLRFVRKLAEVDHAEQTIKAVDLVLKQRQDRLNKLVTKLEEEAKQERQQSAERRERRPIKAGERLQDQPIRERTLPRRTTTE